MVTTAGDGDSSDTASPARWCLRRITPAMGALSVAYDLSYVDSMRHAERRLATERSAPSIALGADPSDLPPADQNP